MIRSFTMTVLGLLLCTISLKGQLQTYTLAPYEISPRLNPAMLHYGFHHPSGRYDEPYIVAGVYHRRQWEKLPGLNSYGAYANFFLEEHRIGLGSYFVNDQLGPLTVNTAMLSFSYAILNKKQKLVLGFGLGYGDQSFSKIEFPNHNDIPDYANNFLERARRLEASMGLYYLHQIGYANHLFASVSIPKGFADVGREVLEVPSHFSASVGGLFYFNSNLFLETYLQMQTAYYTPDSQLPTNYYTPFVAGIGGRLNRMLGYNSVWIGTGINTNVTPFLELGVQTSLGTFGVEDGWRFSVSWESQSLREDPANRHLGHSLEFHVRCLLWNGIF